MLSGSTLRAAFKLTLPQIKNAQDLSTMIRELQELWLFGSLDTLTDPADSAKDKEKALQISQLIETLAKKSLEIHAGEKE